MPGVLESDQEQLIDRFGRLAMPRIRAPAELRCASISRNARHFRWVTSHLHEGRGSVRSEYDDRRKGVDGE
jgi:hypothetical protein